MKVIACIEGPVVIKKVLTYLRNKGLYLEAAGLPPSRRRHRPTCSAELRQRANQHNYGCDPDRSGGMPSGRHWPAKGHIRTGERGYL